MWRLEIRRRKAEEEVVAAEENKWGETNTAEEETEAEGAGAGPCCKALNSTDLVTGTKYFGYTSQYRTIFITWFKTN